MSGQVKKTMVFGILMGLLSVPGLATSGGEEKNPEIALVGKGVVLNCISQTVPGCEVKDAGFFADPAKSASSDYVVVSERYLFSEAEYENMKAYVEKGGVLILISGCKYVDKNNDGKEEEGEYLGLKGRDFMSGCGAGQTLGSEIMVEDANPLTAGLPAGEWVNLGREIRSEAVAYYAVTGSRLVSIKAGYAGKEKSSQPFLMMKRTGKGSCVQLMIDGNEDITSLEPVKTIMGNLFKPRNFKFLSSKER
jgi:hypothetical protein